MGLCASGAVSAQNMIRGVTASQQSNGEVIRVELSAPLRAAPTGFVVQTPPRVAIDLPGVGNGMATSSVELV
jgi:type IV pilus assembly protein PilQ